MTKAVRPHNITTVVRPHNMTNVVKSHNMTNCEVTQYENAGRSYNVTNVTDHIVG